MDSNPKPVTLQSKRTDELFKRPYKNEQVKFNVPKSIEDEVILINKALAAAAGDGPWSDVTAAQKMWLNKWRKAREGVARGNLKLLTQNMFCLPSLPRIGVS